MRLKTTSSKAEKAKSVRSKVESVQPHPPPTLDGRFVRNDSRVLRKAPLQKKKPCAKRCKMRSEPQQNIVCCGIRVKRSDLRLRNAVLLNLRHYLAGTGSWTRRQRFNQTDSRVVLGHSKHCQLSGPVWRDTARLPQRYPPIACHGVFGVSIWPIGRDTPSPFSERFSLGEHAKWRCDTPPQKGYLSDTCGIPYENKAKWVRYPPLAILLWSSKLFRIGFYHFWIIYRNFSRIGNIYHNSRESTENEEWQSALRGTPRITGLAPVRIIYRKKLQDSALCEIIR